MSIAQLWGSGPKMTITCGKCEVTWQQRIPMVAEPGVVCPHCRTVNKLPLTVSRHNVKLDTTAEAPTKADL